jgi:hypothetical protein
MPIVKSPLLSLLTPIRVPALNEAPEAKRDHDALVGAVQALLFLLEAEWHEEVVTAAATYIPHRLGRKPKALIWTAPPSESRIVYVPSPGIAGLWTNKHIVLQASTGTPTAYFALL